MKVVIQRLKIRLGRKIAVVPLLALAALAGCDNSGGLSHFEQVKLNQQQAADALQAKGASAAENRYPQGDAWIVDLSGQSIDEEIIGHLQALGQVAELNLSKSTIADQQMEALAGIESAGTLIKLNVSDTQVSDAGLLALSKLHLLFEINAKGSKITPAGIEQYKKNRPKHPFGLAIKVTK